MAKPKKSGRPKYKKAPEKSQTLQSSVVPAPTNKSPATPKTSTGTAGQLAEQARASYALNSLTEILQNSSDDTNFKHSELKSYIRRLPGMIQMNGFGQAIAFYYAKSASSNGKNAYGVVYQIVEGWLCEGHQIYSHTSQGPHRLLTAITENDQQAYRTAQAETHALMRWLKKFAEALIIKSADSQ